MRITCALGPYLPVPPLLGGAVEKRSLATCEELAARGHRVTMISRRFRDLPTSEVRNGVHHVRVASRDAPSNIIAYRLHDLLYASRVRAVLPPSDITITNSVSMPLVLLRSAAGRIVVDVGRYPKGQMGLYRGAARLRVGSRAIAAAIAEQSPAMASRVMIVPNALSDGFAAAAGEPADGDRANEILFVGRVAPEKGVDLLIRAFAAIRTRYPGWRLSIVGPWQEALGGGGERYVRDLRALVPAGAPVEIGGPIFDEAALRDRYRRAAIFVYPSVAEEGEAFGIAPVEAMACGCATIVSDLACFRDFIDPDVNGLVFDHRAPGVESLAQAFDILMSDGGLRAHLGRAARATASRYAPAAVAERYITEFEKLLREPAS